MSALLYCYSIFSKLCGYNVVFCVQFDEMIHCKPNSGSWCDYRKLLHVVTIHGVPNTGPTASGATAGRHINKPYTNAVILNLNKSLFSLMIFFIFLKILALHTQRTKAKMFPIKGSNDREPVQSGPKTPKREITNTREKLMQSINSPEIIFSYDPFAI